MIVKNYENMVACRQSYSKNNWVTSSFLRHSVDCRLNPAMLEAYSVYTHYTVTMIDHLGHWVKMGQTKKGHWIATKI